jgi:hypothetical protein
VVEFVSTTELIVIPITTAGGVALPTSTYIIVYGSVPDVAVPVETLLLTGSADALATVNRLGRIQRSFGFNLFGFNLESYSTQKTATEVGANLFDVSSDFYPFAYNPAPGGPSFVFLNDIDFADGDSMLAGNFTIVPLATDLTANRDDLHQMATTLDGFYNYDQTALGQQINCVERSVNKRFLLVNSSFDEAQADYEEVVIN